MASSLRRATLGALLAGTALLTGCGGDPQPITTKTTPPGLDVPPGVSTPASP